jgi:RNA polymerase sigma-70 factor (ECF subfamily)
MANTDDSNGFAPARRQFASTRWSVVAAAGQGESPEAALALGTLCRVYWYPLYAYARRRLGNAHDAQDATQAFFAQLLDKNFLHEVDRARGKFRSFLVAAFSHFLSKERDKANAQKRGGGRTLVPLDFQSGEEQYRFEPADNETPEAIFERRWALTLLQQTLKRLRDEFCAAGKEKLFDCLKETLTGEELPRPYAQVADELGISEPAIKVAVHRLRRRYQELLRDEIAQTVARPEDVDEELRSLFAAVRARKS